MEAVYQTVQGCQSAALAFGTLAAQAGFRFGFAGFAGARRAGFCGFRGFRFAKAAGRFALGLGGGNQGELQAACGRSMRSSSTWTRWPSLKMRPELAPTMARSVSRKTKRSCEPNGPRVGEGLDGDEALDEEVVELDEEAVLGAGEDGGLEVFADAVLHELDLLPLHQLALGVVGAALGLGGFEGDGGEFFGREVEVGSGV